MKVKREKKRLALLGLEIFQRQQLPFDGFFWAHQHSGDHRVCTGKAFANQEDCIRDAWKMLTKGLEEADPEGSMSFLSRKQLVHVDRLSLLGVRVVPVDSGDGTEWASNREEGETVQIISNDPDFDELIKRTWDYLIAERKE